MRARTSGRADAAEALDAADAAPHVGALPAGPLRSIADVAGVTVGHATLDARGVQTGVSVVRPHAGDVYRDKVPAAAAVINGFGKSIGLVQVDELGVLETPLALTNTFGVGALAQAQIRAAIDANPQIGRAWPSVNPLVFECNDGYLNDLHAFAVTPAHYAQALADARRAFARGAVGAGRGMSCFDLKGGIGSASRVVRAAGEAWTVGALVLANFGRLPMLTIAGVPVGRMIAERDAGGAPGAGGGQGADGARDDVAAAGARGERGDGSHGTHGTHGAHGAHGRENAGTGGGAAGGLAPRRGRDAGASSPGAAPDAAPPEQGSIIMLVATDAPLSSRQLKRVALRAAAGLARTGSVYGHGSGDIALAFSTAYTVPHDAERVSLPALVADAALDPLFAAAADSVEQAIVDALWRATRVTGRDGHTRRALRDAAPELERWLRAARAGA
ncbi:peptidase S58 family protein [Burkholderia pseudomallei MSHR7527]|uniref:DmpA family aminopeptidase n=1 Tax=Burkholderia pseudomallei TaxID=28450 RepID=UPI00048BF620|nr:P1 family peptidase [Burkholderia pseudomallei]AJX92759.1 peptidase S58 family protein [Burkholderia pseudomallei PB08298010]KGS66259.1 peptidase S58 family protein [Burkholderia pseudomallei MSHR7527]MBF3899118.1 P1 family peptidase [Burkholderia pseudomallei]MDY7819989.1 P1 family peptidase [Burkholderia pseudomallei]MDY7866559.1 P1 family peptidase [Burkholderia pseudomallei]